MPRHLPDEANAWPSDLVEMTWNEEIERDYGYPAWLNELIDWLLQYSFQHHFFVVLVIERKNEHKIELKHSYEQAADKTRTIGEYVKYNRPD